MKKKLAVAALYIVMAAMGTSFSETIDFNASGDLDQFTCTDPSQYRQKRRDGVDGSGCLLVGGRFNIGAAYAAHPVKFQNKDDEVMLSADFSWHDTNGKNNRYAASLQLGFVITPDDVFRGREVQNVGIQIVPATKNQIQIRSVLGETGVTAKESVVMTEGMWYRLTSTFTLIDSSQGRFKVVTTIYSLGAKGTGAPKPILNYEDERKSGVLIKNQMYPAFCAVRIWDGGVEFLDNFSVESRLMEKN